MSGVRLQDCPETAVFSEFLISASLCFPHYRVEKAMIEKSTSFWDSADYLLTDADFDDYLEACLEEARGDCGFIIKAHETIARARLRQQLQLFP